jgi:signal transduction histidine kinase
MIDPYALGVMSCHLLYAVGVYLAVANWPRSVSWLGTLSTWADVFFSVAIAVVTEGATSPSYVFFAFAILAVGCRAGFRVTLQVTLVCVVVYLGLIVASTRHGTSNTYIMRPAYLAITGYLIAYLAQQRLSFEARARELEARTERQDIARSLHDGYVQALAGVNLRLESSRTLLRHGRSDDALAELTELQGSVQREYDEVRTYLRSLVDLERREAIPHVSTDMRFAVQSDFAGSGLLVEHILQIMLEGVRNAGRYAQARSVTINAHAIERRVRVTIDDDGVGFGQGAQPPWTIASRARECAGDARIVFLASGGAHLIVEVPEA